MATKTLDPNASPYFRIPPSRFYLHDCYQPQVVDPHHFCTYRIHLQPSSPNSPNPFPKSRIRPPSSKNINFSLTHVPFGPRIPKSGQKLVQKQWRPKLQDNNKPNGGEKLGFERKRWKNSRKEYDKVLPLETNTTSLMIKNVPNKFTRKLLIQVLDDHCIAENKNIKNGGSDNGSLSAYDFVYLPIDFKRRLNAGFAFVNFTCPEAAFRFREAFHGKGWNHFGCTKIAEISRAKLQGKRALVNNCKDMNFSHGSDEDMPVVFVPARDGSDQAHLKMFTVGKYFNH